MLLLLGKMLVQQSCQVANWAIFKSGSSGHHITQWLFGLSGSSEIILHFKPFSVLLILMAFLPNLRQSASLLLLRLFRLVAFNALL